MYSTTVFTIKYIFLAIAVTGIVSDFIWMKLFNWLTIGFILLFTVTCFLFQVPWNILQWHLIAFAVVLAIGFPLSAMPSIKAFGAGDVKFAMGVSLWIGFNETLALYFISVTIVGAVVGVVMLFFQKSTFFKSLPPWGFIERWRKKPRFTPYGVAMGLCALYWVNEMPIFNNLITLSQKI